LQVYYSILVIIEYAIPLLVMTVAYIKMGRKLWGAKTPGQVSRWLPMKINMFRETDIRSSPL
jgi:hypothetical protein